jgi:PhnB protein
MAAVLPYLNFPGNCAEAFDFYASVFGIQPAVRMQFKDIPADNYHPDEAERVMHIALPMCNGTMLMGADRPSGMGTITRGNDFFISLGTGSEEETHRLFEGLSAGGRVTMPLHDAMWGATFGMFVDKFGIQWMVNYDRNHAASQAETSRTEAMA